MVFWEIIKGLGLGVGTRETKERTFQYKIR